MSLPHEYTLNQGTSKKTIRSYVIGFVLSLLLTVTAFGLVELHVLGSSQLYVILGLLAISQLIVQTVCFIRLNTSRDGLWNLLPFLFALVIITILVGGSLWVMYNLNYNMM